MRSSCAAILVPVLLLSLVPASVVAREGVQEYPDVIDVQVTETGDAHYRVDATLSSPYDSPERYADAFRVKTPDGRTLGVRELLHDHASEQPFTRSLNNVEIPPEVTEVVVEGRDKVHGYGGQVQNVRIPSR